MSVPRRIWSSQLTATGGLEAHPRELGSASGRRDIENGKEDGNGHETEFDNEIVIEKRQCLFEFVTKIVLKRISLCRLLGNVCMKCFFNVETRENSK